MQLVFAHVPAPATKSVGDGIAQKRHAFEAVRRSYRSQGRQHAIATTGHEVVRHHRQPVVFADEDPSLRRSATRKPSDSHEATTWTPAMDRISSGGSRRCRLKVTIRDN